MITTVTLNAAIDKTYTVNGFEEDRVTRVEQMLAVPGGKGINVARAATLIGEKVTVTGFIAGHNGKFIQEKVAQEGFHHDFIEAGDGESRLCLTVLDSQKQTQTELLEPGPTITKEDIRLMRQKIQTLAGRSKFVVMSGSLPKGCPADTYASLIHEAKASGATVILDTSGEALLEGIKAVPFLIKPNEHEIEKLLGKPVQSEEEILKCMHTIMKQGISCVVVSLGAKGALAGFQGRLFRVEAPSIQAINPVGSGDAMVAGLTTGFHRGLAIQETLRLGAACGTANALMVKAGMVEKETVDDLLPQVKISEIRPIENKAE